MLQKTISFSPDGRVNLKTYIHNLTMNEQPVPKRPAIIILPGGAFTWLSETETESVILTFLKEGFITFLLSYYSDFPNQLDDVSRSIWEVRRNADE